MKFKQFAVLTAAVVLAAAAFSSDEVQSKFEVKVVSVDDTGESVVELDSESLGFDLQEMQLGENRSIVDKNGRAVLITRKEQGFSLDVDGETIDLPPVRGHHDAMGWAHGAGDSDVDIRVMRAQADDGPGGMDGVLIFSGEEIDAATQDIIRTALQAAGHSEVHFAGGKEDGPHQVHVIKELHEVREISE